MRRSRGGEGVAAAIKAMGLDPGYGLDWLQKFHVGHVVAAKKEQLAARAEAERVAKGKGATEGEGVSG